MLTKLLFMGHILGCFWYSVSMLSEDKRGDDTWRHVYANGEAARPDATLFEKYMLSTYWSVVLMTTTGYGDVIPTNDEEALYALIAMLVASLSFGYMMSNIGVLMATMDRVAANAELANDQVKDYCEWRRLPKSLGMRVKKQYAFFFKKAGTFDEVELIGGLSPSLRAEVTRYVLSETLGQLPLFAQQLDPEFQIELFPHIRPVSYVQGEIVLRKGEPSKDLMFLLVGEMYVYSPYDEKVTSIVTKDSETMLSTDGEPLVCLSFEGAFGESVLLGVRQPVTYMANKYTETLCLGREQLSDLFAKNRRTGSRIVQMLMRTAGRQARLRSVMKKFLMATLPFDSQIRAALIIQMQWAKHYERTMFSAAPVAALVQPHKASPAELARKKILDGLEKEIVQILGDVRANSRKPRPYGAAFSGDESAELSSDGPSPVATRLPPPGAVASASASASAPAAPSSSSDDAERAVSLATQAYAQAYAQPGQGSSSSSAPPKPETPSMTASSSASLLPVRQMTLKDILKAEEEKEEMRKAAAAAAAPSPAAQASLSLLRAESSKTMERIREVATPIKIPPPKKSSEGASPSGKDPLRV